MVLPNGNVISIYVIATSVTDNARCTHTPGKKLWFFFKKKIISQKKLKYENIDIYFKYFIF